MSGPLPRACVLCRCVQSRGAGGLGASGALDRSLHEPNPFSIPGEDEIYKTRERERAARAAAKSHAASLHVWEKTTASSRVGRTRRISDSELPETDLPPHVLARLKRGVVPAAGAAVVMGREHVRREEEPMADFLAKKREMFLVQVCGAGPPVPALCWHGTRTSGGWAQPWAVCGGGGELCMGRAGRCGCRCT
jgi:hypothetical protein